jgi:hypothetical protein
MEDAGSIISNEGGSIVIFDRHEGTRKINVHRPHLEPTVEPELLQFTGRRLSLRFGWSRGSFLLAKK